MFKLVTILLSSIIYIISPSSLKNTSKVETAEKIGVEAFYITDIFKADSSGAVTDFYRLNGISNSEFVRFSKAARSKGIGLSATFSPVYTSIDHPWFRQSMEADNELQFSNFYHWRDSIAPADSALWARADSSLWALADSSKRALADSSKRALADSSICTGLHEFRTGFYRNDGRPGQALLNLEDKSDTSAVLREFENIRAFWKSKGLVLTAEGRPSSLWPAAQADDEAIQQKKVKMAYLLTQPVAVIEEGDETGIEAFTASFVKFRKKNSVFNEKASITEIQGFDGNGAIVYTRSDGEKNYLVVLNPESKKCRASVKGLAKSGSRPVPVFSEGKANFSTTRDADSLNLDVSLGPCSVLIVKL